MATQKTNPTKSSVMDQLLAGSFSKPKVFNRGDGVTGQVIAISDNEVTLDLGSKSEGVINKQSFFQNEPSGSSSNKKDHWYGDLKVGDKLEAYVMTPENESGQITLSMQKVSLKSTPRSEAQMKRWQKYFQAMERKTTLMGRVTEINKGGLVVEVDRMRGFLPSSQLSLSAIAAKQAGRVEDLVGQEIPVNIIEANPENNRLIFTCKRQISGESSLKMDKIQVGQKIQGTVALVIPLCLLVDVDGTEGIVYSQEVAWQDVEDLNSIFASGQKIEAIVTGKDEVLGRLSLSVKQATVNPMAELMEKYQPDDVVKGTVAKITPTGVVVSLEGGVEGFIPSSKVETGIVYAIGEQVTVMVDSLDKEKQKLYLAPFITSTKDLIYR